MLPSAAPEEAAKHSASLSSRRASRAHLGGAAARQKALRPERKASAARQIALPSLLKASTSKQKSRVVSPQRLAVEAFCLAGNPKSLASEAKSFVISPQCPARAPFWFDFSH
ncbi:MAG: hypothetical protein GXC75_03205 [Xanthomonadaceae bacterium]|nr:hypothetical protein [Xanthomonadaceae bacterium]